MISRTIRLVISFIDKYMLRPPPEYQSTYNELTKCRLAFARFQHPTSYISSLSKLCTLHHSMEGFIYHACRLFISSKKSKQFLLFGLVGILTSGSFVLFPGCLVLLTKVSPIHRWWVSRRVIRSITCLKTLHHAFCIWLVEECNRVSFLTCKVYYCWEKQTNINNIIGE